jgi:hypothetical protein
MLRVSGSKRVSDLGQPQFVPSKHRHDDLTAIVATSISRVKSRHASAREALKLACHGSIDRTA